MAFQKLLNRHLQIRKRRQEEPREPVSNSLSSPGEELELTEAAAPDAEIFFHFIAGANPSI